MTPMRQQIRILRKYATGDSLLAIAADCGVGPSVVTDVISAVGFQRTRARELVRQHDADSTRQPVVSSRPAAPHRVRVRQPRDLPTVAVIRWEEPPPSRSNGGGSKKGSHLAPVAAELRAYPGMWALIHEGDSGGQATGMATHIRLGQVLAFSPAGTFDAVSRRVDGKHRVYAVYLGEDDAE